MHQINAKVQGKHYSRKLDDTKRTLGDYCTDFRNTRYLTQINQGYNSEFGQNNAGISYLCGRHNANIKAEQENAPLESTIKVSSLFNRERKAEVATA